jgi:hypothetical protein
MISLGGWSAPNLYASYYGTDTNTHHKPSRDILRYFRDAGYITAWVDDHCGYVTSVEFSNSYIEKN